MTHEYRPQLLGKINGMILIGNRVEYMQILKGKARKTKLAASDELDLALDIIEAENRVTLIRTLER
jgi:hypothetical protein